MRSSRRTLQNITDFKVWNAYVEKEMKRLDELDAKAELTAHDIYICAINATIWTDPESTTAWLDMIDEFVRDYTPDKKAQYVNYGRKVLGIAERSESSSSSWSATFNEVTKKFGDMMGFS